MAKLKIIAIIPARHGSKRLPGKPLIKILKKTLLERTFENVKKLSFFDDIYIATDDMSIFLHAKEINANPILTSQSCKTGSERILEAVNKDKNLKKADIIVNIQGDHPFIEKKTIEKSIEILKKDKTALISTCATPIYNKEDFFSKNAVKVVFDKFQNALYFSRSPIPFFKEDIKDKKAYLHVGLYTFKKEFFKVFSELEDTYLQQAEDLEQLKFLENGFKIKVAIVKETPLCVDTKEDIKKIEKYLCKKNIYSSQAESFLP